MPHKEYLKKSVDLYLADHITTDSLMNTTAGFFKIIRYEQGNDQLPIITEMDFGHTCPTFTIPYGVAAEIDIEQKSFSLLERGVED